VQGPGRTTGTAKMLIGVARARVAVLVRTWLSLVDVDDCAEAHVLAARLGVPGERYLISGASVRADEAVQILRAITGRRHRVVWIPRAAIRATAPVAALLERVGSADPVVCPGMLRTLLHGHRYDGSRATRDLGLTYTPLEETLRRTLDWYASRGMLRSIDPD
jgi:dihydroflavonol-4-reductase